ncbi:IS110 family transposase [Paraeggerthella sp.]|uniref:IS110 family transposase n=1 Tax=Paraeggerthella sp. TaxID=2897350 RepID=UPI0015F046FF
MHFIGIDIAKKEHFAGIRAEDGAPLSRAWRFANDEGGFRSLLERLRSLGVEAEGSLVAMEATGHYWMALFAHLSAHGFRIAVVNPSLVNAFRKADTMRRTKTDAVDCFLIAEHARFKRLAPSELDPEDAEGLKLLTRYRAHLVDERTSLKNRATSVVDRVFPELSDLFDDLCSATPKALIRKYPTPASVASCDVRTLAKLVKEASRGHFGREKAEEVKAAARRSVGITFALDSFSFELKHVIDLIDHIDEQIGALEKTISEVLGRTSGKWLATVPGIGDTLAAAITAEIGDPERFEGPKQLVAFAGMDATKAESGSFVGTGEKMSKRGSHHLRFALMTAADKARMYDPYFGDYYDSMIARGKHHYVALSGVARKLCGVILVLMKEQRAYERRPSVQSEKKL